MTTPAPKKKVTGKTRSLVIFIDKIIYGIARHWLAVFNIGVGIYVLLPMIVAPTFMQIGATGPAKAIYTLYGPMCHQMASRSFFLYGEQYAYPRELAGTELTPIEAYMPEIPEFVSASTDPAQWTTFLIPARKFLGNAQMGYKMALCERDIAIYGAIFIFGLLYALLRKPTLTSSRCRFGHSCCLAWGRLRWMAFHSCLANMAQPLRHSRSSTPSFPCENPRRFSAV